MGRGTENPPDATWQCLGFSHTKAERRCFWSWTGRSSYINMKPCGVVVCAAHAPRREDPRPRPDRDGQAQRVACNPHATPRTPAPHTDLTRLTSARVHTEERAHETRFTHEKWRAAGRRHPKMYAHTCGTTRTCLPGADALASSLPSAKCCPRNRNAPCPQARMQAFGALIMDEGALQL